MSTAGVGQLFYSQSVHDFVGNKVSTVDGFRVVGFHATSSEFKDVYVVFGFVPCSQVLWKKKCIINSYIIIILLLGFFHLFRIIESNFYKN